MHSATQICVKPSSEFYPYFDTIAALCNRIAKTYRTASFKRSRQKHEGFLRGYTQT